MIKSDPNLVLEKKINETIEEIKRVKDEYGESSFDFQVICDSLNKRLTQLNEEKKSLELNMGIERIRLKLQGEGIGSGSISARVLGPILYDLQLVTDNIANSIDNDPFIRGQIPMDILEQSNLFITETFPGSFGLEFQASLKQLDLTDDPLITKTIFRLFELLSTEIDPEMILDQVSELGPRTLSHYKRFIEKLDDNKINFNFDWHSYYHGTTFWEFSSQKIHHLREVLNMIKEKDTEEFVLQGILTAGSIRRNTFELDVTTSGSNNLIRGKTKNKLLSEKNIRFGEHVSASLVKTTASIVSTGKEKENYYLKEIEIFIE